MDNHSELIESRIMSVMLTTSHEVHIGLGRGDRRHVLTAEGVDRLLVDEMREQNVVERLTIWNADSETSAYYAALAGLVSGTVRNDPVAPEFLPIIDREVIAIREGRKVFLEIAPVFGASVLVLASKIVIVEH